MIQVFLAADTVYDEQLTESFMLCAERMLRPCPECAVGCCPAAEAGPDTSEERRQDAGTGTGVSGWRGRGPGAKVLLVALEKRYNFTLRDLVRCLCSLSDVPSHFGNNEWRGKSHLEGGAVEVEEDILVCCFDGLPSSSVPVHVTL